MALTFQISTGSPTPIYRQIVDQVRKAVATGVLQEGDQLPSVRVLAEQLVVNPNTVARAYSELVRHGLVQSRHGKGLFVTRQRDVFSEAERQRRLHHALEAFCNEAHLLGFNADEIGKILDRKLSQEAVSKQRRRGGNNG